MMPVVDNSIRQAAAFVRRLDVDAAEAMFGRLSLEEASALRAAIRSLDEENSDNEKESPRTISDDGNVELQFSEESVTVQPQSTTSQATSPVSHSSSAPAVEQLDGAAWLRSLRAADPSTIATYLSEEQPRAIAVVLGYLSPELAAGVLQSLPTDEQSRVVAQLAEQRDADPDSLRVIATGLAAWIKQQQEEHERRTNRVATIRQILAATPIAQREQLLAGLAEKEPEVARALSDTLRNPPPEVVVESPLEDVEAPPTIEPLPTIPFDQLQRLDGRALAEAIGQLHARTALLALAAASEALVERLTAGLPRAAAKDLRQRIHRVGPTTLAEIDRAQSALAGAASQVVAKRRMARSTSGRV